MQDSDRQVWPARDKGRVPFCRFRRHQGERLRLVAEARFVKAGEQFLHLMDVDL